MNIEDQPFNDFINENYLDISEEANGLIRFIINSGFDTSEQYRSLLKNIISIYEVESYTLSLQHTYSVANVVDPRIFEVEAPHLVN